ncbi:MULTISPECIES: MerR family transcriptional regulator [Streptomyces]|uniref:DNA-binding transcriptional MerR regulator n=1 Tax=Streptomyces stelliscabiei TaxID=146820 RepID=A0A8I0PAR9_9ACTN|nr:MULTISPECIES: MerR family transcriptional regulator [Streptomyces]KND42366.1 transcriptional regulator [Streptomyces stelliscabiei]MBE1600497.1 DNA-binding transcriptional MerR regulator [Streptomyces stelliscabiei]MDX2518312.1 MerR family transcriptional regulator [Streptomyces stelliscabiei]MDX2554446.1 MerR family transcriptional regulator [Streptomyces stelliscabiei]MDX2613655.1 MerR family transcriptional regulator [Streptomyces stelliscabiei]
MRLAELSERSGVSTATIKYYLREGLLAPGRQVNATTAEYDEEHLRRLRLVRALIQVGKVPVVNAREVLRHVDDESLGRTIRLGAALWALPQTPGPDEEDPVTVAATAEVDRLLQRLGWDAAREIGALSPVHRSLVALVATLLRLGYPCDAESMAPYAELMHQAAARDLDRMETCESDTEMVEQAVSSAVLFEPVLRSLHRLAQEEESARRYGIE